jgi:C-terminal processing protease CtpA/Prc
MCWEYGRGGTDIVEVLCSYFFADPVHLFSIENPRKREVTDTWTTKEVKGKKIIDVPVYILISEKTFSAAECFAYTMQTLNKAIELARIQIRNSDIIL